MTTALFPEKSPYGSPCNGCGLCCREEICPLGSIVFPLASAPCPALEQDGERSVCGLVAHPERYRSGNVERLRAAAVRGIGAGIGCDARMPGEADPPKDFIKAMLRASRTPRNVSRQITKLWRAQ